MRRDGIGEKQEYTTVSHHLPKWMYKRARTDMGTKLEMPLFDYHNTTDHFETRRIKSRINHKGYTEGRPDTQETIHVSQPYGPLHMHELKEMIEICEQNDIVFEIRGDSDHYPGWTVMIEWKQKKDDD